MLILILRTILYYIQIIFYPYRLFNLSKISWIQNLLSSAYFEKGISEVRFSAMMLWFFFRGVPSVAMCLLNINLFFCALFFCVHDNTQHAESEDTPGNCDCAENT